MIKIHEDKIWLPLELFVELKLRNRQRDLFVAQTFRRALSYYADMTEAYWGRLLCQWYQPVDDVRMSVSQLVEYMMELITQSFITVLHSRSY